MRRPSPALVISCLALFVALGGSALAAHDYLITSKSQISPKVLKALRGAKGPAGPAGPAGAIGRTGATGVAGTPGKNGTNGKDGLEGKEGKTGPAGSARGWGIISSTGTIEPADFNVVQAERVSAGVYCVAFGGSIAPGNSAIFAFPIYGGHKVFMQYQPEFDHECKHEHAFALNAHGAGGNLEDSGFFVMVP
jgi:hypothetical protein